jgi:hypothetical protein
MDAMAIPAETLLKGSDMKTRMKLRIAIVLFGGLISAGLAALVWALPAAAAAVCPSCYGFEHVAPSIYVEKGIAPEQGTAFVKAVDEGRQRMKQFWGRQEAAPRILICSDSACFERLRGGGRRGMSIFDFVAVLSPRGDNPVIAAHELSMIELNRRIGLLGFARQAIPVWFNEGVAMYASDDLRYLAPEGAHDRCLIAPSVALPSGLFEWGRQALTDRHLYAKAACATSRWIAAHGGPASAVDLVSKVAAGENFDQAAR